MKINIKGNIYGSVGDIHNSTIYQNFNNNIDSVKFIDLKNTLQQYNISDNDIDDLKMCLNNTPHPANEGFGEKINKWIEKMVTKAEDGLLNIGAATAANILSNAISSYYGILP